MSLLDWIRRRKAAKKPDKEIVAPSSETPAEHKIETLTAREYETFLILIEGYTLRYAAEQMGVSYPTVNTYQTAIYKKLGVNSRAKLILAYKDVRKNKQ